MEENNGRTVKTVNENPTMEDLQLENAQCKQYLQELVFENRQLKQGWAFKRVEFLFKILENDAFSPVDKLKACDAISTFLYPQPQPENKE